MNPALAYAISLKAWYFVGAVYYILFGIIAYIQFTELEILFSTPIILLILIMLLNGLGNFNARVVIVN